MCDFRSELRNRRRARRRLREALRLLRLGRFPEALAAKEAAARFLAAI